MSDATCSQSMHTRLKTIPKRCISVSEFCKTYGVGKTFAYKLLDISSNTGRLSSKKLGGRRLISVDSAEKLMHQEVGGVA